MVCLVQLSIYNATLHIPHIEGGVQMGDGISAFSQVNVSKLYMGDSNGRSGTFLLGATEHSDMDSRWWE
ncbi:Bidirectional sugar transporter SWEET [Psidium guajava]|nr:Bidirectional sugar transporter SWEET [Psidium guajava]